MGYKVLLVDDHDIMLLLQKIIWKNKFGIVPDLAKSAHDAFEKMKIKDYDCFVVDFEMYGMRGDEFIKKLRENNKYRETPVFMLSTRHDMETVKESLISGANDFLVKPLDEDVYFNHINRFLDLTKIPTDFEFDIAK